MMKHDPNNPNSYIPEDNLHCGKSCDFNKTNNTGIGGNGWCPPLYLCGESIASNGINLSPDSGCFPDNGTYEQCSNSENICLTNTCEIPTSGPRAGKESCKIIECNGSDKEGNNLIYHCINDEDCVIPGTSMDEAVCLKGESAIEDEKFKYYKQVGYCKNTNQLRDSKCTTADMLGEKNKDGYYQPTNCSNFKCDDCTDIKGVAGKNNPCDDNMIHNTFNSCAKFGICANNHWQANNQSSDIECLPGSPPEDIDDNLTICCPKNQIADMPNNSTQFCCPIDTVLSPDKKTKLCSLNTEFGYSKRILTNDSSVKDLSTTIPCKSDSECEIYNNDLWKNLGKTGDNPLDISSPEFSTMYCDTNKGVCKAMCGLFDKSGNPPLNSEFGVLNNSHSKHSYCFSKNQECQIGSITYGPTINGKQIGNPSINGIPVCTASGQEPHWTSDKDFGWITAGKTQLFNPDGKTACSKSVSEQTCLNALGKNMYQVNDIEVQDGGCTFEAACNQLPVTFQYPDGKFDSIMCNELLTTPKKFTQINFNFKEKISQSPVDSLSEPGTQKLYYDNTNNCKGNTNSLDPNLTESPLKYISSTKECTPTDGPPLTLTNEGKVCYTGINPITNDCLTSYEKIENFSSGNNQDLIYGAVSEQNPKIANITDGTYNYYCGNFGLKTGVVDPNQIVKRIDDGANINLRCNDDINTGKTATITCYDEQTETSCCQKQPLKTGKILKNGNTWECSGFQPNPNEQYKDYYLCTEYDTDKVGNYKRVRPLLYSDLDKDQNIINNATQYPNVCDLRNEVIEMNGSDKEGNVCELIKLPNGCADLNHNLGNGKFKDFWGKCTLEDITLPPGIEVNIMGAPPWSTDGWCKQEYMCQTSDCPVAVVQLHGTVHPDNIRQYVNTMNITGSQTISGLSHNTCSMSFKLDPNINPHACDSHLEA